MASKIRNGSFHGAFEVSGGKTFNAKSPTRNKPASHQRRCRLRSSLMPELYREGRDAGNPE